MTQYQRKPDVVDAQQWDGTEEGFVALQAFGPVGMTLSPNNESVYIPVELGKVYLLKNDWLCKDYYGQFNVVSAADFNNLYQAI